MIGKVLGDRYEILEKVGGGGMALVYKAKCRLLNRYVAVKILRPEFTGDEEFIKKFKREAQSAASLSHPNIVSIYDVGREDDIHYIVMEYIKGHTLKDLIKGKGKLSVDFATNAAIQICSAIEHAHSNHIVHRDIKAHNIIIREDNSAKVTDFGIARAVSSSTITNTGNIIGSVHYFSPEQARGGYTDEKSDLYSLGVVLYEMVTGRLPFEGETPISVALKHIQDEPLRPRDINPEIPKSLEDIILKCMSKDVMKRYSNAAQIISDLKQSLVMPNGDFVKKHFDMDQNTKVIDVSKINDEIGKSIKIESKNTESTRDGSYKKDKKNNNNKIVVLAVITGLLLAIVVFGGYYLIDNLFNVKEVEVPNIINMSEQEAKDKLKQVGLTLEVTERINDNSIPEGQIVKQDPKEGETNKVTNPIKVTVSKGPNKVVVPSIIGKSYDAVGIILEGVGLQVGNVTQEYSTFPTGIVTSQGIAQGVTVEEGTKIDYVISSGPEKFFMPNYIGTSIEEVKRDLIIKDLILGNITYENSDQYQKDTVINQSIPSSSEVTRKSLVDFVVSKGKADSDIVENKAKLKINLPSGLNNVTITVVQIQGGLSKEIYKKVHSSTDSPLQISISGTGKAIFQVYIGDSIFNTLEYTF